MLHWFPLGKLNVYGCKLRQRNEKEKEDMIKQVRRAVTSEREEAYRDSKGPGAGLEVAAKFSFSY